jgi:1,4-alpha-glucan branching enzyme
MYENFGAIVDGNTVELRLFFPDASRDPNQYDPSHAGLPQIRSVRVPGEHQALVGDQPWDLGAAPAMVREDHPSGMLYRLELENVPDGFYQYKYFVDFENGTSRWCGDPCSRWVGTEAENAAFVVGGNTMTVPPLPGRRPLAELVIYELMIDDFTAGYRGARAPVDAVVDRLDYLVELGVNAVEFMPWMAWRGTGYQWGYGSDSFFAVENRYVADPTDPLDRLVRLKRLVAECHDRGLQVLMDGVFNHVDAGITPDTGFPYHWLYQDPAQSPYTGGFAGGGYFEDLDYNNGCTEQYIFDACRFWLDTYALDGIRLDYTLGFYVPGRLNLGVAKLIADLHAYADGAGRENVSLVIEHLTDNRYEAINVANLICANGCWHDRFLYDIGSYAAAENITTTAMRVLDTARDFREGKHPVTYPDNHDHATLVSRVGGRGRWWAAQTPAIALLTASGAPLIRNGSEFAEDYYIPDEGPDRVVPRPLHWEFADDQIGIRLQELYRRLIEIRSAHPALRGPNFYPRDYDERWDHFNPLGYGVDTARGLAVYHRWGNDNAGQVERFIIALNFSNSDQYVDLPFSVNGPWEDLLTGEVIDVQNYIAAAHQVPSHWGKVFWRADA